MVPSIFPFGGLGGDVDVSSSAATGPSFILQCAYVPSQNISTRFTSFMNIPAIIIFLTVFIVFCHSHIIISEHRCCINTGHGHIVNRSLQIINTDFQICTGILNSILCFFHILVVDIIGVYNPDNTKNHNK